MWTDYLKAFLVGGALCALGQVLIDRTKLTPEKGFLGAFTGGLTASAGGIAAAIFFGYLAAVLFKPKEKK